MPDAAHPLPAEPAPPTIRTCGTMPVHERLLRTDPAYVRNRVASENFHHQFMRNTGPVERSGVTRIPVVVHVVYNTAAQNISDAQVASQIDVLNRDYRKKNSDIGAVPSAFAALATDARIEFQLATTDPNGQPTNGITRTQTATTGFTDDDKVKSAATGGADAWPATKYLNLWSCQLAGGLLGYAQFPGGPAATDGVVILQSAFGTVGTAAAPFNLGRTATHEVGHWLNLRHIWGDDGNGCNGSDFVADTPNQAGPNFHTPSFPHVTCSNGPNGDMFMDYMDYVDDNAMFMFTAGQVDRMQACLDGDRSSIGSTVATAAAIDAHTTLVSVDLHPTLAAADAHPTVAALDLHTTLVAVDLHPTVATLDAHPTVAALDAHPTLAVIDLHTTLAALDHVKPPTSDLPGWPPGGPGDPGPLGGRGAQPPAGAAPFVLSTPHHSMAWTQSFPQLAQARTDAVTQRLQQAQLWLQQYAQAQASGGVSFYEQRQAEAVAQEVQALLQQSGGGNG